MHKTSKSTFNMTLISILLISMIATPLALMIPQASADDPTTVLTPKWYTSGLGTNYESGMVIGDVDGDGDEDIVFSGYNAADPSQRHISVLDGSTGDLLYTYYNTRIGGYSQPQLYDVDGNGVLDILCVLFYEPGLAALRYDGDSTLEEMWVVYSQADQAPGGSVGSGSVMAKPVAGDIDGDGHLDIFLASQDVSPLGGYDGTIVRIDYLGNILATTFTWRACSGGLALGDTDNDGVFELYQGDRDMDYNDGGYGKGVKSYWAANLTERWIRLDDLTSSQAPILIDVNGDGIQDVITGMYNNMWILNSTNGEVIDHWYLSDRLGGHSLSVHYGTTVYDIDGDGNLELLANDGDHDDEPYTDVFDLVTGEMDAQLYHGGQLLCTDENYLNGDEYNHYLGTAKWSPLVADIDPTHDGLEIISCPEGTGLDGQSWWHAAIRIWSSDYELLQTVTHRPGTTEGTYSSSFMALQLGFSSVQDIDGDGLLELVVCNSGGSIYAFNTIAPAPGYNEDKLPGTERIRSEVTYFGETREGVAKHTIMPGDDNYYTAPLVAPMYPGDNKLAIPVSTDQLTFKIRDDQGDPLSYTVTTSPNIGSTSDTIASGTSLWNELSVDVSGLDYDTTYYWTVQANDGTHTTTSTFTFRTELETPVGNNAPTQATPSLVSDDGMGYVTSDFTASAQNTNDANGDDVTNIYRWTVNGDPVNQVLLPFDTRSSTTTKDYSGFGNDGEVIGAAWVADGVTGGAYHFDGKDDAIVLSDGGAGFFNGQNALDNHRELGGFGDWGAVTVEAWVYLDEYTNGSTIVGKIPSYALGFTSESSYSGPNMLYGAVWPYTGEIADDDNEASVDSMSIVSAANVNLDLDTWYHIAFTYESGVSLNLYLNGELVGQTFPSSRDPLEGPLSPSRGEPVYIGRLVQPFAGMIDGVKLYSYALPEGQVQNEYDNAATGDSSSSKFNPFGFATFGDDLACEVTPTDSYTEGTTMSTADFTIINAPPVASDLEIYPLRVRDQRLQSQNLDAVYTYYDADNDLESGSQIRWYKDDVLITAYNDESTIPAGATATGNEWYYTVMPSDGENFGDMQTSLTITIYENTAPTTGTPDLSYVSSDIVGTAVGTNDIDGDDVTNVYNWLKNGNSMANLVMPFDIEVPLYVGSEGIVTDYSGNGNDGSKVGATWTTDGVVGGAYSFNGDDYIQVDEQGNSLGSSGTWTEMTVEYWVLASSTGQESVVSLHDADYSTGGYMGDPYGVSYTSDVRAYSDRDRFYWSVFTDEGYATAQYSDYDNYGVWHHVVCTYQDGVGITMYIDGVERAFAELSGSIIPTTENTMYIGGTGTGADFMGSIDEVRIYPTALSSAQIFQRYIETKDGSSDSSTIVYQETSPGDEFTVTVTPIDTWEDGAPQTSSALTAVTPNAPTIDWYNPANSPIAIDEGASIDFSQISTDPNGDPLTYSWTLDTIQQATTANWTYSPDFDSQGAHTIRVTVNDGLLNDFQEWTVNVEDVSSTDEGAYLVVRGQNGRIYTRLYNSDTNTWDAWEALPSGMTNSKPAATVCQGELYIVVQGYDDDSILWFSSVDLSDETFSGWTQLSYQTSSAPTLASNGTHLVLTVRGMDDFVSYSVYDCSAKSWSAWNSLPTLTSDQPAAAIIGNELHLVIRGYGSVSESQTLWYGAVNLDDNSFSGWTKLAGETDAAPVLSASKTSNELYLSVKGMNSRIYMNHWTGSWQGWNMLASGWTNESPAIALVDDALHFVVKGQNGLDLWHCSVDLDTSSQSSWVKLSDLLLLHLFSSAKPTPLFFFSN